jgi:hypothetical protein
MRATAFLAGAFLAGVFLAATRDTAFFGAAFFADVPARAFAASFFLIAVFAFGDAFLDAVFFPAPLRRPALLAMSFHLSCEQEFHQIIHALSSAVQEARTKLIAEGLPVFATIPIGDNAPVDLSIRNPVMSSLSWFAA